MQADIAEGATRLVAPVGQNVPPLAGPANRALPLVRHDGRDLLVVLPLIGTVIKAHVRKPVGSLRAYRDDLTRALDWLFLGI